MDELPEKIKEGRIRKFFNGFPSPLAAQWGVLSGLIFGLMTQTFFRWGDKKSAINPYFKDLINGSLAVMSLSYVFVLPIVIGALTVFFSQRKIGWVAALFYPWISILLSAFFAILVGWEGLICFVMAIVIALPLSSLGGITAWWFRRYKEKKNTQLVFLGVLLILPFSSGYLEQKFDYAPALMKAENSIVIQAPPQEVWKQIIEVKKIEEPITGYFYKMGFPKPIEATLQGEGVGAVRLAKFDKGLQFIETIDQWEDQKQLSFSIKSDPSSTPPTTLDSHVVVGGEYFDVLRGTYQIEPLENQQVRLHLSSQFRVSTRFNFYAGLWAKFLMNDIQKSILEVLKQRAESISNLPRSPKV